MINTAIQTKETEIKKPLKVKPGSVIIGKNLGAIEREFQISIMELNNNSDRAFVFSWENPPEKTITVKPEDEIVASGKPQNIEQFSRAALLN